MVLVNLLALGVASAAPPVSDAAPQRHGASLNPRSPIPDRVVDDVVGLHWSAPSGLATGAGGDCPDFSILCPMLYEPVLCSDGNIYFNECAANYWGCASGCSPLGSDMLTSSAGLALIDEHLRRQGAAAGAKCPDFSVMCPMSYDPVICGDGQVYFNECAAQAWGCAEDCVPYEVSVLSGPFVPPGPHGGPCQGYTVDCPMVFDPVRCADGNVYVNRCFATYYGCAEDCVPLGDPEQAVAPPAPRPVTVGGETAADDRPLESIRSQPR